MQISEKTQKYIDIIKKEMESIGVMSDADNENLEFLTSQVELYNRAMEDIDQTGLTVVDTKNRTVVNPSFTIQRSAMCNIIALMKELSLSARQRRFLISAGQTVEEDPMDEFLNKMNEM